MQTDQESDAMRRDLQLHGLDPEQTQRHDFAFGAAKVAVVALLCARHGTDEIEMLDALMHSRRLAAEAADLMERSELSSAFVGYIHSGIEF